VAPQKAAARTVSIPSAHCLTNLPPVVGVAVSSCRSGPVTPTPTPSLKPTIKLPSVPSEWTGHAHTHTFIKADNQAASVQSGHRQSAQMKKMVTFPLDLSE